MSNVKHVMVGPNWNAQSKIDLSKNANIPTRTHSEMTGKRKLHFDKANIPGGLLALFGFYSRGPCEGLSKSETLCLLESSYSVPISTSCCSDRKLSPLTPITLREV